MIKGDFEESAIVILWLAAIFFSLVLGMMNDGQKQQQQGGVPRSGRTNGFIPSSFRAISSYLRIVSSGASTVARSAASVASSIVDRDDDNDHDQVIWAGFDKLEGEGELIQQVLLLGYRSGFQIWDVEDSNNVRDLVSRHDGPVSFMQMLPKPIASKRSEDKFADSRPLLVVCADGFYAGGSNIQDGLATPCNGNTSNCHDQVNGNYLPTAVKFYSLRSQSYVHVLKFRSVVYSVRCSSRVVAVSQSTQIHCFDATTLEREYTLLTNPIVMNCPGSGGIGYGPLAVGPRWLAYSGSPVVVSNSGRGRVSPQHLTTSASFPGFSSNGSLVAHYAKESSKQLAAGIVTLGDMAHKKLSRYCSELLPESNGSLQSVNTVWKGNGTPNGHLNDTDNIGMVIVRDIISKNVVAQFRAHKSPISALCFDPSGTILVTASVQGHNINVYKIMPGHSESLSASDACSSHVHLYRLQRGFTNAVIQDISFSDDSNWIMISSSRGTSHLFAINPQGGSVNIQSYDANFTAKSSGLSGKANQAVCWPPTSGLQMPKQRSLCASGPPITLSVVSRIRSGTNGWRGTVSGAAAAATGRMSSLSGAIASSFHNCKALYVDGNYSKTKYQLLVFSPTGSMIQYVLRTSTGQESVVVSGLTPAYDSALEPDARLIVEAIQKWNICQRRNRREREDNIDIYGENGISDSKKIYPEEVKEESICSPKVKNLVMKETYCPEEEHHLFISEAELQMHQPRTLLWAKPEIYFQSMVEDSSLINEGTASGGEIEVDRIPTRMIESRSKDLVPIFDYIQTPKFQQARTPALDSKVNRQLLHQSSGMSENGRILSRSMPDSPDCMTNSDGAVSAFNRGFEGTEWNEYLVSAETKGFVNNNDSPKARLEIVNNKEHLNMEAQLMFVNNEKEGLNVGNHFEYKGNEFY